MGTEIKYARNGDVNIAYRVIGDGPFDLVFVHGWVSNIELLLDLPEFAKFFERLAAFSRVILFDRCGVGMSDRVEITGSLEKRIDDLRAVMDAAESKQAALVGVSEGGPMSMLFAATYPERVRALVLFGTAAKWLRTPEAPWAVYDRPVFEQMTKAIEQFWGTGADVSYWVPSQKDNEEFKSLWARFQRASASPGSARRALEMCEEIDVRAVLPSIKVPTLVLHRAGDRMIPVAAGRHLVKAIANARMVEFDGIDHIPFFGDSEAVLGEIEEFLTGTRQVAAHDCVLATVLFVDIVDSTQKLAVLGNSGWKDLLGKFQLAVRRCVERFRGREVDTAGDGFLASFDGPARAIRCAGAIRDQVRSLGLEVRAGLHTGECEILDGKVAGIAVHIGSRVAGRAAAGEILVSRTLKDLVAGSGLEFSSRGEHELKGIAGSFELFATVQ